MTVMDDLVTRARANHHDVTSGPARVENVLRRHTLILDKSADDAAASTATTERAIFRVPAYMAGGVHIRSVHYTPDGALTADDTNFATITFSKRDGAGGSATIVAEETTETSATGGSGDHVAHTPLEIPLSATVANQQLAAGEVLTYKIAKSGSGVAVQAGSFTIVYDEK